MSITLPKSFKVPNGPEVPSLGLGSAYMYGDIPEVVYSSIKHGIRLIDTAACYGTEEKIGKGIKRALNEGIVKRSELFITTKLFIHDRKDPEEAIKKSLKKLQLDYVDLYLDHWPRFFGYDSKGEKVDLTPLHLHWPNLESLVEKGYTKYIGVSNYNVQTLCNLLSFCKIKPLVNEIEFHPYLYQKNLLNFCRRENILVFGYNPLVKGCYSQESAKETRTDLLGEDIIVELSKKYNKTPGQIVFNWSISNEVIPIPMTGSPTRMIENLGSMDFSLEKEDLEKINSLNKMFRFGKSEIWDIYDNKLDIFA